MSKALQCFFKYCLLIILVTILFGTGCKKNNNPDSALPPLTFEGKNTIGCKINGISWTPKGISGGGVVIYPTKGGYYEIFNSPLIHIWLQTNDPVGHIDLFIRNHNTYYYLRPGKYFLNKNTNSLPFGYGFIESYGSYWTNGKEYITDSLHHGWVEVLKSDSVSKIISGKFEFSAYNVTDGKIFQITEGRFDFKNH